MTMDAGRGEQPTASSRFSRHFAAGQIVFAPGDAALEAYLLQNGRVRLVQRVGGREKSVRVVQPGEIFGEQALVPGTPRSFSAVALVESSAIVLAPQAMEELIAGNPATGLRVLQQLVERLRDAEQQIELLMLQDPQEKVAAALVQLAERAAGDRSDAAEAVGISLSPLELSARVGLDVETVRRLVRELRSGGYVSIEQERVLVPDVGALRKLRGLLQTKGEIAGSADPSRTPRKLDP